MSSTTVYGIGRCRQPTRHKPRSQRHHDERKLSLQLFHAMCAPPCSVVAFSPIPLHASRTTIVNVATINSSSTVGEEARRQLACFFFFFLFFFFFRFFFVFLSVCLFFIYSVRSSFGLVWYGVVEVEEKTTTKKKQKWRVGRQRDELPRGNDGDGELRIDFKRETGAMVIDGEGKIAFVGDAQENVPPPTCV